MCDRVDTARRSMFCVPVEHTVYFDTDSFLNLIFLKGAFMSLYITLNWPCDFAFNEYIHGVLAYFLSLRLILCLSVLLDVCAP